MEKEVKRKSKNIFRKGENGGFCLGKRGKTKRGKGDEGDVERFTTTG
jgi:hypothetical protein